MIAGQPQHSAQTVRCNGIGIRRLLLHHITPLPPRRQAPFGARLPLRLPAPQQRAALRPSALASLCAIMPALKNGCDARVMMGGLAVTEYAREDVQVGAGTVQNVGE